MDWKKEILHPDVANALTGDLWSDTDNNPLYIFTGSVGHWLVPEYSDGLLTGSSNPVVVTGKDEINYTILQVEVAGNPVAIYSTKSSTKTTIVGFTTIKPGINLFAIDIGGAGVGKFYGTSEKAENLLVSGVTVAATKFLRADVTSTSNNTTNYC